MLIEEYRFWPPEKTRFLIKLSILIFIVAMLAFGLYGWYLYQEKIQASHANSQQQSGPAAASLTAGQNGSANTLAPSLSPLPVSTNSD